MTWRTSTIAETGQTRSEIFIVKTEKDIRLLVAGSTTSRAKFAEVASRYLKWNKLKFIASQLDVKRKEKKAGLRI